MLEIKKYSNLVLRYSKILKNKKSLGPYSNPKNEMGNLIKLETKFLDVIKPTIRIRICYILNGLYDIVKCPICGKNTKIDINKEFNYKIKGCSIKCCNIIYKTIKDPISGLTNYQTRNIKGANTKRNTTINGINIFKISGAKISKTLNRRNINGKSIIDIRKEKYFKTILKIKESGKTRSQEISDKSSSTMKSKINPKTGLTISKSIGLKVSKAKSIIMSDGRTKGQHDREKSKNTIGLKTYDNREIDLCKLGFTLLTSKIEFMNNIRLLKYKCNKCNSIRESYWPYIRCTTCNPYNKSIGENEVLEFCKSFSTNVLSNNRSLIPPLELDIYLPDHNIAIEYNGLFWHSSYSIESENQDYHLMKTQKCTTKGIQLFHIFENEWQDPQKQLIWKSIIKNRLGHSNKIFARKTGVRSVPSTEKSEFLISNHLQGDCVSSVNLGLFLDDELVSLMTFGKSRYDKKVKWELIRFCNKIGCSVVGGASRLLKYFRLNNSGSIISYADRRRSNGNLYKQLGFKLSHESDPNYFYWKPGSMALESRIGYQNHKLRDKLGEFDSKLTESENMYRNGYRKIYDCGIQVYIL